MRVNYALKATAENHIDIGRALDQDSDENIDNCRPIFEDGAGESYSKDLKEVARRIK